MEEENKYRKNEEDKICTFCKIGNDNLEHYVDECKVTKEWFEDR